MRIATMKAMNEDTPTMTLFFTLLNEVLAKSAENQSTNSTHPGSTLMKLGLTKMQLQESLGKQHLRGLSHASGTFCSVPEQRQCM